MIVGGGFAGVAVAYHLLREMDAEGRTLIPACGELTAGRLLAPLRRSLQNRLELRKPPPAENKRAPAVPERVA